MRKISAKIGVTAFSLVITFGSLAGTAEAQGGGSQITPAKKEAVLAAGRDRCSERRSLASPRTGEKINFSVVNDMGETIFFQWINFSGELDNRRADSKQEIPVGRRIARRSYIDHIFIVTNSVNQCIGIWNAQELALLGSIQSKSPSETSLAATDDKLFLGTWCGQWNPGPPNRLTVDRVTDEGDAYGIYAWATGSNPFTGKITDGVLKMEFFDGKAKVSYWLTRDGTLAGTWKTSRGTSTIVSKRC